MMSGIRERGLALVKSIAERFRLSTAASILAVVSVGYWLAMYTGTHIPRIPTALAGHNDKSLHFWAYFVLGLLLVLWQASRGLIGWKRVLRLWLIIAAYGIFDEVTQPIFGRNCDFWDWVADLFGSAVGTGVGILIASRFVRVAEPLAMRSD